MCLPSLEAAVAAMEVPADTLPAAAAVEACWLPLTHTFPLDRKQSLLVLVAQRQMTMAV